MTTDEADQDGGAADDVGGDGATVDEVIVIGYGNDLRGDDAAGRRVADAVAARHLPGVRVLSVVQLTPELAADLAGCRLVVFVDASLADRDVSGRDIAVRDVVPTEPDWRLTHHATPSSLVTLAAALSSAPRAVVVTIPAADTALGTTLSPTAAAAVPRAVDRIVGLVAPRA